MPNKEREWAVLRTVYAVDQFAHVAHGDAPDFELRHHGSDVSFGVEITELYETASDARAHNHPDYIPKLLAGERHMHPDDVRVLSRVTVSITDQEGNLKAEGVPAVIRSRPSMRNHYNLVAQAVRAKDAKAESYLRGLSHVNLIIMDHMDAETELHEEYSAGDVLVPELRTALLESRFREVFLVSTFPKDGHQYFRPLQLLVAMEMFRLTAGAMVEFDWPREMNPDDVAPVFIDVSRRRALGVYAGRDGEGNVVAVYRGAGLRHDGHKGIAVLDFHDRELPSPIEDPLIDADEETLRRFLDHHTAFMSKNEMTTGLSVAAVEPAPPY